MGLCRHPRLGVNVDHVATLRQSRLTKYPDPLTAALICESAGADQITVHLREDRRHVQDGDLRLLRKTLQTELNLEMAATDAMTAIAVDVKPDTVTLVPEKRKELTTEGGLNAARNVRRLRATVRRLAEAGIRVSLFIDPDPEQIDAAVQIGVSVVELHTGRYSDAADEKGRAAELLDLQEAADRAHRRGLIVCAGHGLNYENVSSVARLPWIEEFNIGHSIVARALFVGFERAVVEMIQLIRGEPTGEAA